MIERRVVVDLAVWDEAWQRYRELILFRFDELQPLATTDDDKRKITWNKTCADRELARLKGTLDGTYRP